MLAAIATVLSSILIPVAADAAKNEKRALRAFHGPYQGSWTRGGTPLSLKLTMPKTGVGKGRGTFEATPCDPDDGLSPLAVTVKTIKLSGNCRRLVSRGKATWRRSRIPQLGGPNPTGKLNLTAVLRGKNNPSARGRITSGALAGLVNIGKRGILPEAPKPWMEMVWVGNPGNRKDAGNAIHPNRFGAVAYDFKIGKYEVTNAQYAEFLNAVAQSDPNGLYDTDMNSSLMGGISRTGSDGSYTYQAKPLNQDNPVAFVGWLDACRFCNWLHNRKPAGPQGPLTTEKGAYDLTVPGAIDNNEAVRSQGARYFVPTEDEWYKAAYHDPRREAAADRPETIGTGCIRLRATPFPKI